MRRIIGIITTIIMTMCFVCPVFADEITETTTQDYRLIMRDYDETTETEFTEEQPQSETEPEVTTTIGFDATYVIDMTTTAVEVEVIMIDTTTTVTETTAIETTNDRMITVETCETTTTAPEIKSAYDCNGDGEVSIADAVIATKFLAEVDDGTDYTYCDPDFNGDGRCTIIDVAILLTKIVNMMH